MTEPSATAEARPEPLFSLDLLENGGLVAPATLAEISLWIQRELTFWSWVNVRSWGGNHDQGIKSAINQLSQALNHANQALQHKESNPQHYRALLLGISSNLKAVFLQHRLPHSSTPLAKRVDDYRENCGDLAATFFAAVFVPPPPGHQFQPQELLGWRGMTEGLIDRFSLSSAPQKGRKQAAEQSFEQLRLKAESLVGEKTTAYDALHRDYSGLVQSIKSNDEKQTTEFDASQKQHETAFERLVDGHKHEMESCGRRFARKYLCAPRRPTGTKGAKTMSECQRSLGRFHSEASHLPLEDWPGGHTICCARLRLTPRPRRRAKACSF